MATRASRYTPKPTNGRHTTDDPGAGSGSEPGNANGREKQERNISSELTVLLKQLRELREYFLYFVIAKIDSLKLSLRHVVVWVVLAALGFVALSGLIVIASWFILSGVAEGLGGLFDNRFWLGSFATGILILGSLWLGTYYAVSKRSRIGCERTTKKYEGLTSLEK